jgi:predicted oxidoreductase
MERRLIHPQGPILSRIISGVWRWHDLSSDNVRRLIYTSLEEGITTFDHADIYGDHGNEEIFGNVIRSEPALRNSMELVTKCGVKFPSSKRPASWVKHYDTSAGHVRWSVDNSLKMLGTDRLDVLLIHRPDPLLNPHELAEVFQELRTAGKVLHFGVSNFTTGQYEMLQSFLPFPLITNQIEVSVTHSKPMFDGTIDQLMKLRISPMAWSPLGGGILTDNQSGIFRCKDKYDASSSEMAIAWLLKHPSKIFPVIGTTKPERIREAARATAIRLDRQDWFDMLKSATGNEVP